MTILVTEKHPAGHNLPALCGYSNGLVNDSGGFLPDVREELGVIAELVDSYNKELLLLKEISANFIKAGHQKLYSYLSGYNHNISAADALYAENALRSEYWKRVMSLTDVLPIMSDAKRTEWDKQFTADRYHTPAQVIPEFEGDAIVATVVSLLNDRNQFIQERVYDVFKALSRSHKTNKAYGFSTRMITTGVCEKSKYRFNSLSVDFKESGISPLSELRVVCAYLRGEQVNIIHNTRSMVESLVIHEGLRKWICIDGDSIRFRVYKNGSMHIEVHPDIAERLNNILSAIIPLALPSDRKMHNKKTIEEFPALKKCIDFNTRMQIAELRFRDKSDNKWSCFTSLGNMRVGKGTLLATDILKFLGATVTKYDVSFSYDPTNVIRYIGQTGTIPDIVSHQFYPSSERISEYVFSLLGAGEGDTLLEPNIGHGDLLKSLPIGVQVTGIELDTMNCLISRAKGFETIEADFLAWSKSNQQHKFSYIVMNPPFADNRAKLHLQAAASHLNPGGAMAAVLPLSLQRSDNLLGENFRVEWLDVFDNEFENTSISVRILYAERIN